MSPATARLVAVKVSTEKIPDSQILMTVEIEPERLEKAREKAVRKLAPQAKVPGFRPGKAPPAMIRQYFGEARILDEAIDELAPAVYREVIESDESIDPIERPVFDLKTVEPLVFEYRIPVRPTVELGDYASIKVEHAPVEVDQERIDDTLLMLRRRMATLEPVEREIAWRDVVRIEVEATVEVEGAAPALVSASGQPLVASKQREPLVRKQEAEIQLMEDRDVLLPGFEEELLGHRKGETITFELPVPDDIVDEKLRGKHASFTVQVLETKEEVLPELNEEFAKQVGDYENVEALTERVRDDLKRMAEDARDAGYQQEILDKLVEQSTIEYPPVLLENEVERMLHEQAGHIERGEDLERYLAAIGKTEEEMRAELRPLADARIRRALIVRKASEAENIEVTPEEVSAEVEKLAGSGPQAAQLRQLFDSEAGRDSIHRRLVTDRTLERLVELATGVKRERPPAPQPVAAPEAAAAPAAPAAVDAAAETAAGDEAGTGPE